MEFSDADVEDSASMQRRGIIDRVQPTQSNELTTYFPIFIWMREQTSSVRFKMKRSAYPRTLGYRHAGTYPRVNLKPISADNVNVLIISCIPINSYKPAL